MKVALISDLHCKSIEEKLDSLYKQLENERPDIIINAGDNGNVYNYQITEYLEKKFKNYCNEYIFVSGNHDYYDLRKAGNTRIYDENEKYPEHPSSGIIKTLKIDDYVFIYGTLWTNMFDSALEEFYARNHVNDYNWIFDWEPFEQKRVFDIQKKWIFEEVKKHSDKKVFIITHHAPSKSCIGEKFINSPVNGSFVNDLDNEILYHENIKYWAHGHVHDSVDVQIENCRIICNPRGHASEKNYIDYKAKIIEI